MRSLPSQFTFADLELQFQGVHLDPILRAMQPAAAEIETAAAVLTAAQAADWAPIRVGNALHDRASYRYCWSVLQQARAAGAKMPAPAAAFFGASGR